MKSTSLSMRTQFLSYFALFLVLNTIIVKATSPLEFSGIKLSRQIRAANTGVTDGKENVTVSILTIKIN